MSVSHHSGGPGGADGHFAISSWAIRNPIPVAVIFLALTLAGLIAYAQLTIKQFPNVEFPMVVVTVTQNGSAPSEMETQVTRPVEDAMAGISNVKNVRSTITQGTSVTTIEFELGEDLQLKTDEVRTRMGQVRAQLPREIDEPNVNRVELSASPIMIYAASAPAMSDVDLSWFVDDTIARTLQSEKGVGEVKRIGGVNREINVVIDPDRMAARGLTAPQVNDALRAFSQDAPGGRVELGGREQTVRVLGAAGSLEALRALTIPTTAGPVRLIDIAEVGEGSGDVRGFARLNGRPVVAFQVSKTVDSSDVAVEDNVLAALERMEKAHPGLTFTKISSTVDETRASFTATEHVLVEGMFLAALVVLLFLRDWRSTAIAALAMPVSLIPTFFVMQMVGFSLNLITLLALTLVIGILVDDAIVEVENIEKRIRAGQRPYQAALEGADAIGLAVVATTATIVVVFTPVSFMKGIVGAFFREFGVTVSVAVLFSLLVARLLTPLMAAYFLKPSAHPKPRAEFKGFYRKALEWSLDHRILASVIGGVLFFGSLGLGALLPQGFIPQSDPNYIYISVRGPPGATAQQMEATVQRVTAIFKDRPEVESVFANVGSSGPGDFGVGGDIVTAAMTVVLNEKREISGREIRAELRERLRQVPDARVNFLGDDGAPGLQEVLVSDNPAALQRAGLELERQMRRLNVLADPRQSGPPIGPELIIRPRADEAARLGVSVDTIARVARVATVGDIDANVAKLTSGERRVPIRVRLPADARADVERIRGLRIPTVQGGFTTLDTVADISLEAGPPRIDRLNRKRQITVQAEINGTELGDAHKAVSQLPIMKNPPAGVTSAATGDVENFQEMMTSMAIAVFVGVSLIYAVLVLLFRSFFKPVIILSALPLAVCGAFMGLLVFNLSVSLPSLIGFLMLLGLAAKNSILLVEYAIEREREGMAQREALIEACRERSRPILMTTLAMMAGMLPTALALESGSEFRQPMAVAVIGGLITSTALSLVLVPVVYEFVDDLESWLRPKLARFVTPRHDPAMAVPDDRL